MRSKDIYFSSLRVVAVVLTVLSTAIFGFSAPSTGQYIDPVGDAQNEARPGFLMNISMGNALKTGRVGSKKFADRQAMQVYYEQRENRPYWLSNTGRASRAEEFLEILENSWTHGLNPNHYHIDEIRKIIEKGDRFKKAELELLLTDAFVRYARDLSGIRVDPKAIKLDPEDWRKPMSISEGFDLLAENSRFGQILRNIEPRSATYKKLQQELIRLSQEDEGDYEQYLPVVFGGLMKPGWGHKGIPKLRARMGLPQPSRLKGKYDDELAAAIMKFQRKNDLEPDGIIGAKTLQLLNRTKHDKMLQLVANMERLRWVEEEKPDRFIVVNIPSAMLWAIDGGRVDLEMPVIVGSPWRRTRVFQTDVTGVRLNPTWTIPATIKRYDILPKVKEDPNYLFDKGIELIRGYGSAAETLDPASIDWETISIRDLHDIRFVQIPGEHNPLGRVRILMPNAYNMYLHDTNHPEYFLKPERQVSSGCIRMKYPEKVADFVMKGQRGWGSELKEEVFESMQKTDFDIRERIPVYVLYYTAWIGDKGRVVYGTDVYNYDEKLIELLQKIDGFVLPGHNTEVKGESPTSRSRLASARPGHNN